MDAAARAADALRDLNAATGVLAAAIGGLTDAAVRAPSLLPGWTRGHVLTHLARNAEGSTRLLGWARTGVPSYEYESMQARAAAIEAGAGRPAAVLIADVRQAAAAFADAATGMPAGAWQRVVRYTGGQERTADVIVSSRLAEVHIHHVDLDIGHQPRDWPAGFVSDMLPRIVRGLNERDQTMPALRLECTDTGQALSIGAVTSPTAVIAGPDCELLAWLLGRSGGSTLTREPPGALPVVPAIY
jgi:maleylpyruvate isomerase